MCLIPMDVRRIIRNVGRTAMTRFFSCGAGGKREKHLSVIDHHAYRPARAPGGVHPGPRRDDPYPQPNSKTPRLCPTRHNTSRYIGKRPLRKPQEEFASGTFRRVQKILNQTGIYEVVPWPQVRTVLGDQDIAPHRWRQNDWALARHVGQALHADYVLVAERGFAGLKYWQMVLINLQSGKRFVFTDHKSQFIQGDFRSIVRESFRKLFNQAKGDMLALAVRKGRLAPAEPSLQEQVPIPPDEDAEPPEEPKTERDAGNHGWLFTTWTRRTACTWRA